MLTYNAIAKKFRCSCSGMRNQRFLFRQFQLECLTQEVSDRSFDFLGFFLWATEAKHPIISIPHVAKSAVMGVLGCWLGSSRRCFRKARTACLSPLRLARAIAFSIF